MSALATLPARRLDLIIRPLGEKGRYVVKDPRTGAFFTFGEQEAFLLDQLDGRRDAAAVCQAFAERFGEPLSEGEVDQFLELVRAKGFLVPDAEAEHGAPPAAGDPAPQVPAAAPKARQSILYWRKSLFDPDRLFGAMVPWLGFVWTRAFLLASAGCVLLAAAVVWANGQELVSAF